MLPLGMPEQSDPDLVTASLALLVPDEPVPVRLMNTIWADRYGVHDALETVGNLRAWLAAVHPDEEAGFAPRSGDLQRFRALRDALRRVAAQITDDQRPRATSVDDEPSGGGRRSQPVGHAGPDLAAVDVQARPAAAHPHRPRRSGATSHVLDRARRNGARSRCRACRAAGLPSPRLRALLREGPSPARMVFRRVRKPSARGSPLPTSPLVDRRRLITGLSERARTGTLPRSPSLQRVVSVRMSRRRAVSAEAAAERTPTAIH